MFRVGSCAQLACVLEVTAHKPGNVHPGADFADCRYVDYLASAVAIGPVLERAVSRGVGATVLAGVRETQRFTSKNTNLGILLLLSPLAAAAGGSKTGDLRRATGAVLRGLSRDDARAVYEAIRLARPGGLGTVVEQDVSGAPTGTLLDVMRLAAERDLVARQYQSGFREVFEEVVPALRSPLEGGRGVEEAIIEAHLRMMAQHPDSLIARKLGMAEAEEARRRAAAVLEAGWPDETIGRRALEELDEWLRSDGNRRNPGTTADLVTAGLFVAVHGGIIEFPLRW